MREVLLCCLLSTWRLGSAIENSKGAADTNNIGEFVGQLTSLLNQGAGGYLGQATGYQSPGLPYPSYPVPGGPLPPPGRPYPSYPGPGGPPPPPGRPYPGPPGAPYPPPYQQYPSGYPGGGLPAPSSLYGALSSIARYDDLRCVPRLLCEVASGARPGSYGYPSYSQESPVPFLSKDALVTLLTVLNFVDDSPLLVFGRAALLGYTARGDSRACLVAYPTCPRDPDHLVDYLNNHNGGFFRFFNQQLQQYAPQYQHYQPYPPPYPSQGPSYPPQGPPYPPQGPPYPPQGPPYPPQGPPYPPQGPPYPPQGPFLPNRPPLYAPQGSPQRPPRPYAGYPQQYSSQNQSYQSRIQTQPESILEFNHYTSSPTSSPLALAEEVNSLSYQTYPDHQYYQDYFSTKDTKSKFVFPHGSDDLRLERPLGSRGGKKLNFPKEGSNQDQQYSSNRLPFEKHVTMVFPDRTGTGDLRLDVDEHGDYKTVYFASHSHRDRDLRQVKFPREQKMQFPQ